MENVRTESFLGGEKVIVGNKYTDLVLETLGKVYVKTGNSSKVLSDVLKLLDKTTESDIGSKTIIVGSITEMEEMEYPGDGYFVFNTLTKSLYIAYDERYVALIEAAESASEGYVKRSGDTMTGQLEITSASAPLIVSSSKLVRNLNAEHLDGYSSNDFAKIRKDEYILGNWTFRGKGVSDNNWTFKKNVRMYGDLVSSGSLTSPEFASGFGGYGWRLDADTNTLTIDYLVVRKAMRVYEMVINKISATNGSLWISNASKCAQAVQPRILTNNQLSSTYSNDDILALLSNNTYYLPQVAANTERTVTKTEELSSPSKVNTDPVTYIDYKFIIYIKDPAALLANPLFTGVSTLYNEDLLTAPRTDDTFLDLIENLQLYYINKERVVTEWNNTTPLRWTYRNTFKKDTEMMVVPKGRESEFQTHGMSSVIGIQPYYKYFGLKQADMNKAVSQSNQSTGSGNGTVIPVPNLWVIDTDPEEFPPFKPGDIIRCQKYSEGNVKYYDALVMSQIDSRKFIVQKAHSVFDMYTEISYNLDGTEVSYTEKYNDSQYNRTELGFNAGTNEYAPVSSNYDEATGTYVPKTVEDRLDDIAKDDDMVQIGNIFDKQRQNAVYITSSDDDAPYIDVISGLNRPDYSVLYDTPIFDTKKVNLKKKGTIYERQESFVVGKMSDYYYQITNPGCVNPSAIPDDIMPPTKEFPLVFLRTKDVSELLINDGEQVQITQEILNNPEEFGVFLTEVPTRNSQLASNDKGFRHAYTKTTKVRLGNLDGIYNETFGAKQPYGYGLYSENVFLTGEFYLNNGESIVDFAQDGVFLKFKNAGLSINSVQDIEKDEEGNPLLDAEGNTIPKVDENGKPVYVRVQSINLDGSLMVDDVGNPVYQDKTEIVLTADQIKFNTVKNKTAVTIVTEDPVTGLAMVDVQGMIQARGLYIYGEEKTDTPLEWLQADPETGYYLDSYKNLCTKDGHFITSMIKKSGDAWFKDAYLKNAYVEGTIDTERGRIGGFEITSWGLQNTLVKDGTGSRYRDANIAVYSNNGYSGLFQKAILGNSLPASSGIQITAAITSEAAGKDGTYDPSLGLYISASGSLLRRASGSSQVDWGEENIALSIPAGGVNWRPKEKDYWCMPGVLCAFRYVIGENSKLWGNGAGITSIFWRDRNLVIEHSIGHMNYYPFVAPGGPWDNNEWHESSPILIDVEPYYCSFEFKSGSNSRVRPRIVHGVIFGQPFLK